MLNFLTLLLVVTLPCISPVPVVDGTLSPGEWDNAVHVVNFHMAGRPDKPIVSTLKGGWRENFYGLLEGVNGAKIQACDPETEYWVTIDNGPKIILTNRAFVNEDACLADAMEFSFPMPSGHHVLDAHTNFYLDGEPQTGAPPEPVAVETSCPTAVHGPTDESRVIPFQGQAILIMNWTAIVPFVTVYGPDIDTYKGEAHCFGLTCVFVDPEPSVSYWVKDIWGTYGPIWRRRCSHRTS